MGRQSQSAAWSTAVVMGLKVTLGCLLACSVSSVPLDAGYGVPAAPLILAPHQPAALPLQLLHAAPPSSPPSSDSQPCPTYLSLSSPAFDPPPPSSCTLCPPTSSSIPGATAACSSSNSSAHPSSLKSIPCAG